MLLLLQPGARVQEAVMGQLWNHAGVWWGLALQDSLQEWLLKFVMQGRLLPGQLC